MPHFNIKMYPGRTEEQKAKLTEAIVKSVASILETDEKWVSVAIEDVEADDWADKVYNPEIIPNLDKLYKKPGY
jgi:4-oxalocrotonate tautomerase